MISLSKLVRFKWQDIASKKFKNLKSINLKIDLSLSVKKQKLCHFQIYLIADLK